MIFFFRGKLPTALGLLFASLLACVPAVPALPDSAAFVQANGGRFVQFGRTLTFVGVNVYNAAGDPAIFECGYPVEDPEATVDSWLGRIRSESGSRVVRFWAFQSYTAGGENWTALDRLVRLAKKHDFLLMPVLENQWADCTRGGVKGLDWYREGFRAPYGGYALSYKEYVRRVIERYRDEPAILAWTLMNEAEIDGAQPAIARDTLYDFTREMTGLVKSIDSRHLLTLGLIGAGQPGVAGNHDRLYSLSGIDFIEFHDYDADDETIPGRQEKRDASGSSIERRPDSLAAAIAMADKYGKPIMVAEAGIKACPGGTPDRTNQERARKFDSKIGAFFNEGGAGYLIWAWNPGNSCSFDFTTGDPLNAVLTKFAKQP